MYVRNCIFIKLHCINNSIVILLVNPKKKERKSVDKHTQLQDSINNLDLLEEISLHCDY